MKTVGSYEAKTHLPRLLQEVEAGAEIVITRHGKAVARLVPVVSHVDDRRLRAAVKRLKQFRRGRCLGNTTIRDLIEEGRR